MILTINYGKDIDEQYIRYYNEGEYNYFVWLGHRYMGAYRFVLIPDTYKKRTIYASDIPSNHFTNEQPVDKFN
tara:strand:- start:210 stop:428 length:219 start_codon:yes stop_codon:yes gene_type:complete